MKYLFLCFPESRQARALALGLWLLVSLGILQAQEASHLPDGYTLQYEQDFEKKRKLKDFEMTDPSAWTLSDMDGNQVLELVGRSEYRPRVRSPFNMAMMTKQAFGSFVMEVDLLQTGREYGHRDLCLFFSMKDPANFYYVHMASKADPHAHNIFLVNDEPRVAIAHTHTDGIDWGQDEWHKVRVERDVEAGTIRIFYDDMSKPIMEAEDKHFDVGYIGLGSFDDSGKFDNLKIWAPAPAKQPKNLFR